MGEKLKKKFENLISSANIFLKREVNHNKIDLVLKNPKCRKLLDKNENEKSRNYFEKKKKLSEGFKMHHAFLGKGRLF